VQSIAVNAHREARAGGSFDEKIFHQLAPIANGSTRKFRILDIDGCATNGDPRVERHWQMR